jgi:hypothetical protein
MYEVMLKITVLWQPLTLWQGRNSAHKTEKKSSKIITPSYKIITQYLDGFEVDRVALSH